MHITAIAVFSAFGVAVGAQTHKVAQPEDVVRAVGVYEWIGERTKPTANRLIPVTLFIDGDLQDAGVYLARPIPFALDRGTIYEIDHAGVPEGTLSLAYSSHLRSANEAENYDEGWFGYGTFAPPPAPKKTVALKESKAPAAIVSSKPDTAKPDPDRPTLGRKADQASAKDSAPQSTTTDTAPSTPADDPDRPHLGRRQEPTVAQDGDDKASAQTPASTTTTSPSTNPANDPDRPTLKKRSPEEAKKAKKEAEQSSATGLATSLNDDPNRPTLHHGTGQQALTEADLPKLKGIPTNLHQAVAVSDAKTRPEHDFARPWADDTERASILAKMQALAYAQIAAYKIANPAAVKPAPLTATRPLRQSPNSKLRHAKTAESVQPHEPLFDEKLNGYTLSYGGAATYVYTARTDGEGAALIYVTIVAQIDAFGGLKAAIQNVTDATHLNRTPWMRMIDVVDADASNRASLLFELRGERSRQFALYRVIATRSEQVFLTGTMQ